jgi:tetratricopeptide (TPR) repeat protein
MGRMATIHEIMTKATELHQAGELREAERLYRQVVNADPTHVFALNNLGILASQADRHEEAISYLRRALALEPGVAEFHGNLAIAYKSAHGAAASLAEFREALRLKPNSAQCHTDLAEALLELGQVDDILPMAQEALRLEPGWPPAYGVLGQLSGLGKYELTDEDLRQMHELLEKDDVRIESKSLLHFTLAAWWEKKGEYDAAFRDYTRGNDLRREIYLKQGRPFNPQAYVAQVNALMAGFAPAVFEKTRGMGVTSERPIFVVGMVRSGTTLVEQILSSHPQVFGCGELRDIDLISTHFYPACSKGITVVMVRRMAEHYLQRLAHLAGKEPARVVDKMPRNFLHLGMIAVLFPNARVIHCRRDPLDTCISAFIQNFQHVPYGTSLEDLGLYYRHYERLMEHWRKALPMRLYEVQYEELVADQERISRELIAFCGLEWDKRCLSFHKNPRPVKTVSRLQVRQPIYNRSVARWKRFEKYLQPLHDALAGVPVGSSATAESPKAEHSPAQRERPAEPAEGQPAGG